MTYEYVLPAFAWGFALAGPLTFTVIPTLLVRFLATNAPQYKLVAACSVASVGLMVAGWFLTAACVPWLTDLQAYEAPSLTNPFTLSLGVAGVMLGFHAHTRLVRWWLRSYVNQEHGDSVRVG
jgi:hypothetical protein